MALSQDPVLPIVASITMDWSHGLSLTAGGGVPLQIRIKPTFYNGDPFDTTDATGFKMYVQTQDNVEASGTASFFPSVVIQNATDVVLNILQPDVATILTMGKMCKYSIICDDSISYKLLQTGLINTRMNP